FIILNCSQFCVSDRMFLMVILKVAALQKEGQLNYINALTRTKRRAAQLKKCIKKDKISKK
ncbi:MAG: hypothetical protein LBC12_04165, partial [Nitrososphaerota archaeon]|nr:hypothetical protein [Nitrososphaerota archaeon]